MSIHINAYDTIATRGSKGDAIKKSFEELLTHPDFRSPGLDTSDISYTGSNKEIIIFQSDENSRRICEIPSFAHPILLNTKDGLKTVVDVRHFCRADRNSSEVIIKNVPEYELAVHRGILNQIFATTPPRELLVRNSLPMSVFSSWITDNLAKRLSLGLLEQFKIRILAAYYYCCLFTDEEYFSDLEKDKLVGMISRGLHTSYRDTEDVLVGIGPIQNLEEFTQALIDHVDSPRLKGLKPAIVIAVVMSTWFGANAREMLAVALEHPPTWISIVYTACTSKIYKNTAIAKTAERNAGRNFSTAMNSLDVYFND